jgi:DNA-binding transcriptional ArsR family regulator
VRPLSHPAIDDVTVEGILHALSDPLRVLIFKNIAKSECAQTCSTFLEVGGQPIPKSTLSQHFKVLRETGLVRSERKGVELHNVSRCQEIDGRFPGLLAAIVAAHQLQIERDRAAAKKRARSG